MAGSDRSATQGTVPSGQRALAPDLARGFMLLLIAMAYAPVYLYSAEPSVWTHPGGGSPLDAMVRILALLFLDNRAFPMFAALFGYGMVVLIERRRAAGTPDDEARRLLRRRSLFLLLFGSVHAILVFSGEILAAYGLAGLVIGWLLFRPDRALLKAAALLLPFYALTAVVVGYALSMETDEAVVGYLTAADWIERLLAWPITPVFNLLMFPLLVPLLLGAWAARRKLLEEPAEQRTLLTRVAVVGIAISLLGALPAALTEAGVLQPGDLLGLVVGVQIITGIAGGAGYAALFGLLALRIGERRGLVVQALSAAGQRSLSLYLFVSVLVAVVLHRDLLDVGSHVHSAGALGIAFLIWLLGVALCYALHRAGRKGPADALLRRLVYR